MNKKNIVCIANWGKPVLQIGAILFYYKLGQTLLQIGLEQLSYKLGQLLQIRASVITNWGKLLLQIVINCY